MRKNQMRPETMENLERLMMVGESGMGALSYRPPMEVMEAESALDYDYLAGQCRRILNSEYVDEIDNLLVLGGSSGGARPKILTEINDEDWIVKFPGSRDDSDQGELEYRYSLCARACGLEMSETRLIPSKICKGYFATKRFDRYLDHGEKRKIHMLSVSGLLETSHRIPNLDYHILMKLTLELTKDFGEVEKMFRLMCFNVFSHNRDDHSKNFSFLYSEEEDQWHLSPAYDLTYSYSVGGEHATTINGIGMNPGRSDLLEVGKQIGMKEGKCKKIIDQVADCVQSYEI